MRSRFSVAVAFICGATFAVAALVRCGTPPMPMVGGDSGMTPAMAGPAGGQTMTAQCDHTITDTPTTGGGQPIVVHYAVFPIQGLDPANPPNLTAWVCYGPAQQQPSASNYMITSSPGDWYPQSATTCEATTAVIGPGAAWVSCPDPSFANVSSVILRQF